MLPDNTHPAIKKKLDELRKTMRMRVSDLESEISDLKGSLNLPGDFYGIKLRSLSISSHCISLIWLAGQIEALRSIPYDMISDESSPGATERAEILRAAGFDPDLLLSVLDWVLEEQLAGRRPNDEDVAKHFNISIEEATKIHDELEKAGEFD